MKSSLRAIAFVWTVVGAMNVCQATMLTFDQFVDATKTTRVANNNQLPNQAYGDNVDDFSPAGLVGGQFVNYGSDGGLTPNVTVEYRWYHPPDGTGGTGGSLMFDFGYGPLEYVAYASAGGSPWLSEIRFIPEADYSVRINSFDYAGFNTDRTGQTLKIVADAASMTPLPLWSAGADGAVTFPGAGATATPNVVGAPGQPVSLLWGFSSNAGLDNISFSQIEIPEPTCAMLLTIALTLVAANARRRSNR